MTKYFIQSQQTGGTLAVEKYLNKYFHENYFHAIVSEDKIQEIIADLSTEQTRFFETRKGKSVNIKAYRAAFSDLYFINIGSVSFSLPKVEKEIL